MEPKPTLRALCDDLNTISAWLAIDDFASAPNESQSINAIVLFGNQVVATLIAACQLAQVHHHALLLFSGGVGHSTHLLFKNLADSDFAPLVSDGSLAPNMGEAATYAIIAQRAFSIPAGRIVVESQSTNGGENARFSLRLLQQEGLAGATILLIQDPIMQRRSVLTWQSEAERAGQTSLVLSHAAFAPRLEPGPDGLPQLIAAHSRATWTIDRYIGLLLGEIARLRDDESGYGPRGKNFLPHVDIPAEVWESYQRVLASPIAAIASR